MRISPLLAALCPLLLAACASKPATPSKVVVQATSYKVHPDLIGQPVPAKLQTQTP